MHFNRQKENGSKSNFMLLCTWPRRRFHITPMRFFGCNRHKIGFLPVTCSQNFEAPAALDLMEMVRGSCSQPVIFTLPFHPGSCTVVVAQNVSTFPDAVPTPRWFWHWRNLGVMV